MIIVGSVADVKRFKIILLCHEKETKCFILILTTPNITLGMIKKLGADGSLADPPPPEVFKALH